MASAAMKRRAVAEYQALHGGLSPVGVKYHAPREFTRAPKYLVDMGPTVAIERLQRHDDGDGKGPKWVWYRHDFKASAAPMQAFDDKGRLHLVGGNYKVTERGITDMSNGKLLSLSIPRMNPEMSFFAKAAIAGVAAVAIEKVADALVDSMAPRMTERSRSFIKAGGNLVIAFLLRRSRYQVAAAAFAAAGFIELGQLAYREWGMQSYVDSARTRLMRLLSREAAANTNAAPAPAPRPGETRGLGDGVRSHMDVNALRNAAGVRRAA